MEHTDFRTGKKTNWEPPKSTSGRSGGDFGLAFDWIRAVSSGNKNLLTSTIGDSIESHAMSLSAEKSRINGSVETL